MSCYALCRPLALLLHTPLARPSGLDRRTGAGDRQRICGHVLVDRTAGRDKRSIPDRHRGDERGVCAYESLSAYRRLVLAHSVVVARHHARPDVRPLADLGITDIRQMRGGYLCAERCVLQLNEITDLH